MYFYRPRWWTEVRGQIARFSERHAETSHLRVLPADAKAKGLATRKRQGDIDFFSSQIFHHRLSLPDDTLVDIGGSVGESFGLTTLSSENAVQIGADLIAEERRDRIDQTSAILSQVEQTEMLVSSQGFTRGPTGSSPCWAHRHRGYGTEHIGS
jgi:hypothetical protein